MILFFLLSQWDVGFVFGEEKKVVIAEREKKLTIAVVDFTNTRKDPALDYLVKGIPESIITYLGKKGEVHIVERSRLQSALDEMELQMGDIVDEQTAVQLGKQVGANAVLVGSFLQITDMIRINSRLMDIETSKIITAEPIQGATKEILGLMDQIADAWWRKLTGQPPQEERGTLEISLAFLDEKGVKLPRLPASIKTADRWRVLVSAESVSRGRVKGELSIATKEIGGSLKVPPATDWVVTAQVYKGDVVCNRGKSLPVDVANREIVPVTVNVTSLDIDGDGFCNHEDLFPYGNAKIQVMLKSLTVFGVADLFSMASEIYFQIKAGLDGNASSWPLVLVAPEDGMWWSLSPGKTCSLNWVGFVDVADTAKYCGINISMWDHDAAEDDLLDINPNESHELTLKYDLTKGTSTGDDTDGVVDGREDGIYEEVDGRLEYEIKTVVEGR